MYTSYIHIYVVMFHAFCSCDTHRTLTLSDLAQGASAVLADVAHIYIYIYITLCIIHYTMCYLTILYHNTSSSHVAQERPQCSLTQCKNPDVAPPPSILK